MTYKYHCKPWEHELSRRQMLGALEGTAVGMAGLSQLALADELKRKDRQVLLVWLDGGMSQLETWDPKPDTRYGGPYIPCAVLWLGHAR